MEIFASMVLSAMITLRWTRLLSIQKRKSLLKAAEKSSMQSGSDTYPNTRRFNFFLAHQDKNIICKGGRYIGKTADLPEVHL